MGFRMKGTHRIVREITTDEATLRKIAELLGADPEKLKAADVELIYKEEGTAQDQGGVSQEGDT